MPIKYKFDVIDALYKKGITTYDMRLDKIFGESTIQKLRKGLPISWANLEIVCQLLDCQPGDILEFVDNK